MKEIDVSEISSENLLILRDAFTGILVGNRRGDAHWQLGAIACDSGIDVNDIDGIDKANDALETLRQFIAFHNATIQQEITRRCSK